MEELEIIVSDLENGSIELEESIEKYQRGIQLKKHCDQKLKEANMDFDNVVKTSIFLSDMNLFNEVNEIYGKYIIKGDEPARETIAVKTLPMNVNVEISMIAIL